MGRLCSLKRSLRRRLVFSDILNITFSTLNHVNHVRRFTGNMRFDLIHLSSITKSILRSAIFDIRAGDTIIFITQKRTGRKSRVVSVDRFR